VGECPSWSLVFRDGRSRSARARSRPRAHPGLPVEQHVHVREHMARARRLSSCPGMRGCAATTPGWRDHLVVARQVGRGDALAESSLYAASDAPAEVAQRLVETLPAGGCACPCMNWPPISACGSRRGLHLVAALGGAWSRKERPGGPRAHDGDALPSRPRGGSQLGLVAGARDSRGTRRACSGRRGRGTPGCRRCRC
jgi:hypothetical protein